MNPLVIGPLLEIGKTLLDRFGPEDPEEKRKAESEFLRMAAEGELKTVIAQLEINAKEASSPSLFVSGWRPGAGWAGVFGLLYATVLFPMLVWLSRVKGWPEPPQVDAETLMAVLMGMLGLGGLRTYEKGKGLTK